jgi:inhibitor of cysteine peptidase
MRRVTLASGLWALFGQLACGGEPKAEPTAPVSTAPTAAVVASTAPGASATPPSAPAFDTQNPMRPVIGGGPPAGGGYVPKSDTPEQLETTVGAEFTIVVDSNPSTGFSWKVVEPLDTHVAFVSQSYEGGSAVGEAPLPGRGGKATLRFKAVTAGEAKVTLRYARPWEQPGTAGVEAPVRVFTVMVK